ncbi:hypothetical protein [Streptomyces griseoluteus]|uniref:hypothetical protein n=1 Tax=Streptomyces griseoluteus TaxID=29306 RepID=UPI00342D171C
MLRIHRPRAGGPGAGPLRTSALAGLVAAALLLSLGGASAEQGVDGAGGAASAAVPSSPDRTTFTRCGPELASPEGLEAQTCVLTRGGDTWARVYYRNTTGDALDAGLSLLGPDGRAVRTTCVTGADDAPATCETPREPTGDAGAAYTAVSEFARGAEEPLLLRSASNSADRNGS